MSVAHDIAQASRVLGQRHSEYAPVIWMGGGISWTALTRVEMAIRQLAAVIEGHDDPSVVTEINNLANACHAELTKRPKPDPSRYL